MQDASLGDDEDEDNVQYWGFKLFDEDGDDEDEDEDMEMLDDDAFSTIKNIPARPPHHYSLPPFEEESEQERARRQPYFERLVTAAHTGDTETATAVLDELEQAGVRAGPRVFHAVVCAFVKAQDPEGGVQALHRGYMQGEMALSETYQILIKSFVVTLGDTQRAEDVIRGMARAEHDSETGWNLMVDTLYKLGKRKEMLAQIESGRKRGCGSWQGQSYEQGFVLNSETYLHLIKTLCSDGKWEEAEREMHSMPLANVTVEAKHWSPILRCLGLSGEKFVPTWDDHRVRGEDTCLQAEIMLFRMKQMVHMPTLAPDRSSIHAVMEPFAYFAREYNGHGLKLLEIMGAMRQDHIEPNAVTSMWMASGLGRGTTSERHHALFYYHEMRKHMQTAAEEYAAGERSSLNLSEHHVMQAVRAGKGATQLMEELSQGMRALLFMCAKDGDGQYVVELLNDMQTDRAHLTPDMMEEDQHGRSVLTSWMFYSFSGWRRFQLAVPGEVEDETGLSQEQGNEGEEQGAWGEGSVQPTRDEVQAQRDADKAAAILELRSKAASKMTVAEIKMELESYGLPNLGLRQVVYKRLQTVRKAIKDDVDPREAIIQEEGEAVFYGNGSATAKTPPTSSAGTNDEGENLAGLSDGFFEDADMKWFLEVQALDDDDEEDEEEEELEDDDDEQGDTTFPKEEEFAIRGTMQDLNVSFEEASRVLGITKPNEVDIDELDPNVDAISGSRYRANEMSLRRRLEVGMQVLRLAVEMGGYPVELDYETLMYHAVAADDLEAVKKLQVLQATRCRPSTRHLHPMRAPQRHNPDCWNPYLEGPWGKKSEEAITSNWAPAQCLDNSNHYQSMLYKCIERNEWDAAAYVIYWMDDARWDVPADLREQIEARMSQKVH